MGISRVTSLGTQNQSMGTKEICILVVKDDQTCRNLFKYMIQHPINSEGNLFCNFCLLIIVLHSLYVQNFRVLYLILIMEVYLS